MEVVKAGGGDSMLEGCKSAACMWADTTTCFLFSQLQYLLHEGAYPVLHTVQDLLELNPNPVTLSPDHSRHS